MDVKQAEFAVAIGDSEEIFVDIAPLVKPVLDLCNVADLIHLILTLVIHQISPHRECSEIDTLLLELI